MKYLKRTGPSWWRGGGGSVPSLHPKTEAIHTPRPISPHFQGLFSHVILRHTPRAGPAQFLLPFHTCPTSSPPHQTHPHSLPAPTSLVHLPTSAQAPTLSPLTQANRCQHLSTPMHTHTAHPFPALHTCGPVRAHAHTHTHIYKMRPSRISKKDTQNVNNFSACKGQMRPPVPGGRPECQRSWPGPGALAHRSGWQGRRAP